MERLPLSVLLLTRNESARLPTLLPALGFAREVVVVDDRSEDGTPELAERLGARVFRRPLDGFGAQRRFGLEQCREPWVLWIDADERLDERATGEIRRALSSPNAPAAFRLERATWFLGGRIRHSGWGGERVVRLFRRDAASFDDARVHESVRVEGAVGDLDGLIEHASYESWDDCRDKLVRYAAAGAERERRAGRRAGALDLVLRPPLRFVRDYVFRAGFLDGARGVAVCGLSAAQVFLKYAELWARPANSGAGEGAGR
jgi:glycosyltransferase involved in cell wall biosynthesis